MIEISSSPSHDEAYNGLKMMISFSLSTPLIFVLYSLISNSIVASISLLSALYHIVLTIKGLAITMIFFFNKTLQ